MRLYAHCLILMLAPAVVQASEALAGGARGGCTYSNTDSERAGSSPGPAARSTAPVAPPKPAAAPGTGSGGGDDDVLQRMRAPKWHSFLPGMFR